VQAPQKGNLLPFFYMVQYFYIQGVQMDLDNFMAINSLDNDNMLDSIRSLAGQIVQAWELGMEFQPEESMGFNTVLLCGTGSTHIAGHLLQSYLSLSCKLPIHTLDGFSLPAWVENKNTLVLISGFSGDEPELNALFSQGLQRGCHLVVISAGGQLIDTAKATGVQYIQFAHAGPMRTALGYGFFLPLAVLQKFGLVNITEEEILSVSNEMQTTGEQIDINVPVSRNPAKRMAGQFLNRWITLFGSGFMAAVAERWKSQIHENAKAWAQVEKIPMVCHSTLGGMYNPEPKLTQMMTLFLESSCDHPSIRKISEEARKMFMVEGFNTDFYMVKGSTPLSCIWNAILYGDFISYYLALAYGVDPTPNPGVEEMEYFISQL
jgi:glucose/mannose-6-phosphate isomerase